MLLRLLSWLGRYLLAEGPYVILFVWVITARGNTPAIPWSAVALVAWALFVAYRGWYRAWKRAVAAETGDTGKAEPSRTFVQNPREVLTLYWRPGYDALQKVAPVIGQWICVTGYFEGEAERLTRDGYHVTLRQECGRELQLQFPRSAAESVKSLRPGEMVTAICRVGYGARLLLESCEVVEASAAAKVRCA